MHSPFGAPSWEPRFVVEHYSRDALRTALELWRLQNSWVPTPFAIARVARRPDYLVVDNPRNRHPDRRDPWVELSPPISLDELARSITAWLETEAVYPAEPWFDGDEAKGFIVFGEYYQSPEANRGNDGALIVMPKWFEIHK